MHQLRGIHFVEGNILVSYELLPKSTADRLEEHLNQQVVQFLATRILPVAIQKVQF